MIRSQQKGAQKLNFFWQPSWGSNAEYQREAEISISKDNLKQEHLVVCSAAQSSSSCGTSLGLPKAAIGRIQATAFHILFKLKHSKQAANKCFDIKNLPLGLLLFLMQFFSFFSSFLLVLFSQAPLLAQQTRSQRAVLILIYFRSKGREIQGRTSITLTEHNRSLKIKKKKPGSSTSDCHRSAAGRNGFTTTQMPWAETFVPVMPWPLAASSSTPGGYMGLPLASEGPHIPKNMLAHLLVHYEVPCTLLRAWTHTCGQPLEPHKEKASRVSVKATWQGIFLDLDKKLV